jgi:hypothetical protein
LLSGDVMSLENTVENLIDALHDAREYVHEIKAREYLANAIRMAENDLAYAKLNKSYSHDNDAEIYIAQHYMK